MTDFTNISDNELLAEIERRKKIAKINITPLDNPDIQYIINLAKENIESHLNGDGALKDFNNWAAEAFMITVFGPDIFDRINKIR